MGDTKVDKNAMSRALGAAFLNHQVQQLEKTIDDQHWNRDRRGPRGGNRQRSSRTTSKSQRTAEDIPRNRRSSDKEHSTERDAKANGKDKDADIIIVDASVLVHALGKLQAWCKNNRNEIVIVPLEALNTLDLLKKGTSPLAQRARAASRILEQQVGSNTRIKVQRDEAYVLWDKINFAKDEIQSGDSSIDMKSTPNAPEWLRRTISCARWELDQYEGSVAGDQSGSKESDVNNEPTPEAQKSLSKGKRVALAVCLEAAQTHESAAMSLSPVPLPVPSTSKYEQRCSGTLVAHWAKEAGIPILECKSTPLPPSSGGRHGHARAPSDEEWRNSAPMSNNNATSGTSPRAPKPKFGSVKGSKSPANGNGFTLLEKPNVYGPGFNGGGGDLMVERPAATMAMNASMMQSRFSKPIRVLARGEKLEPFGLGSYFMEKVIKSPSISLLGGKETRD